MHDTTRPPLRPARRQVLAGGLAAAAIWSAPAVTRFDPVAAAVGSCSDQSVNWSNVVPSVGGTFIATGSAGGLSIRADITPTLSSGSAQAFLTGGGRFYLAMSGHQIGDTWRIDFTFDAAPETVCTATLSILDIDQNGRLAVCPSNSRFRDEIFNITGAGRTETPAGALIQSPPGTWGSNTPCKTSNQENLTLGWTQFAGVTGAGFSWRAGTPPDGSSILDRQLIHVTPVVACITGAAGAGLAAGGNQAFAASTSTGASAYDPVGDD